MQKIAVWTNNHYAVITSETGNKIARYNLNNELIDTLDLPANLVATSIHAFSGRHANVLFILTETNELLCWANSIPDDVANSAGIIGSTRLSEKLFKVTIKNSSGARLAVRAIATAGNKLGFIAEDNQVYVSYHAKMGSSGKCDFDPMPQHGFTCLAPIPGTTGAGRRKTRVLKDIFLGNGFLLVLTQKGNVFMRRNEEQSLELFGVRESKVGALEATAPIDGISIAQFKNRRGSTVANSNGWVKVNFYNQQGDRRYIADLVVDGNKFWARTKPNRVQTSALDQGLVFESSARNQLAEIQADRVYGIDGDLYWIQRNQLNVRKNNAGLPTRQTYPGITLIAEQVVTLQANQAHLLVLQKTSQATTEYDLFALPRSGASAVALKVTFPLEPARQCALWSTGDFALIVDQKIYINKNPDPDEERSALFITRFQNKYLEGFRLHNFSKIFAGEHTGGQALFILAEDGLWGIGALTAYNLGIADSHDKPQKILPKESAAFIDDIGLRESSIVLFSKDQNQIWYNSIAAARYGFFTDDTQCSFWGLPNYLPKLVAQGARQNQGGMVSKIVLGKTSLYILIEGRVLMYLNPNHSIDNQPKTKDHFIMMLGLGGQAGEGQWYEVNFQSFGAFGANPAYINELHMGQTPSEADQAWFLATNGHILATNGSEIKSLPQSRVGQKIEQMIVIAHNKLMYIRVDGAIYELSNFAQEKCIAGAPHSKDGEHGRLGLVYCHPISNGEYYFFFYKKEMMLSVTGSRPIVIAPGNIPAEQVINVFDGQPSMVGPVSTLHPLVVSLPDRTSVQPAAAMAAGLPSSLGGSGGTLVTSPIYESGGEDEWEDDDGFDDEFWEEDPEYTNVSPAPMVNAAAMTVGTPPRFGATIPGASDAASEHAAEYLLVAGMAGVLLETPPRGFSQRRGRSARRLVP